LRVARRTAELTIANKHLLLQIEERKRLERELLDIIERERRRIGQELHDSIGQQLTGIQCMTKVLERKLTEKSLPESGYARDIAKYVNQSMDQARALAKGLHAVDLDSGSLKSALEDLATMTQDLFSVHCVFNCDHPIETRDAAVAIHVYRVAQEAVTNAIKHGNAKHVVITLASHGDKTVLTVHNDGKDFPEQKPREKGMGLHVMEYRAEMINGSLDVRRGENGGTIVTCVFPNKTVE
jgi:two-component system sensor histidine kinase UhpB